MKKNRFLFALLAASVSFGGCGDDDNPDDDAGCELSDACIIVDTAPPPDTALPDMGDPDMAPPDVCGDLGNPCTPDRGCPRSTFCQAEIAFDQADDEDITDLPAGTDTSGLFFAGGYCTPDDFSGSSLDLCDPNDDTDTTCGSCGSCVSLGQDTMCLRDCAANATDNDICRDDGNYSCDLNLETCFPGCSSEAECRIGREETNGIPELQTPADCEATPADCGGDANNYDELTYDTESDAVCNSETFRCDFTGTPGAEGGDTCTRDGDCEDNGDCINFNDDDGNPAWPGGYCTRFRCDIDGIDCAGDGKCMERGLGIFLCVGGCTVGDGEGVDDADPTTWTVAEGGCRDGYTCQYDGAGGVDTVNGGCVPGGFNDITAHNTGEACADDDDCFSPFGRGFCIGETDGSFVGGYCTIRDCGAAGLPSNICGDGHVCVPGFDSDDPTFALCLDACDTPDDCRDDYGCIDIDGSGTTVCFDACQADMDCKDAQNCDIPAGAMSGSCVDD